MYEVIAFYTFSLLTIALFGVVVISKNALYSMSALAGGMIFIAGFFFMLEAEFLGVVQIIVYTGAVMALYAFGMMFFDTTKEVRERVHAQKVIYTLAILVAVCVVFIVSGPIVGQKMQALYPSIEGVGNIQMVGLLLFTKYLVVFELAAIMLLVAMISGILLVSDRMNLDLTLKDEDDKEREMI
ncbi:MAG: NADH-quinone oxidoreductase subunit J [Sulfurospirillum sp.]|nr:NADH-quinone oxidoreductase subunit J [Sulfurospirillum sp.]